MLFVATLFTVEFALTLAILLAGVAALKAPPGCVSRVNFEERYASQLGLVPDESSKLSETPGMQFCPLSLAGPDPREDARQVFDGDSTIRAFCGLDDAFGNYVILVPTVARFFSAALL